MSLTKEQAKIIYKDIIKTFGFVENPTTTNAFYILKNGTYLDTCGGFPTHQHINIAKYVSKKYKLADINELNNGSNFMMTVANAVKVTCWDAGKGIKGIYLPKYELTGEQYDAIEFFVSLISKKLSDDFPLWVATYDERQQIEYKKSENLADRVIADIENYYYSRKLELTEHLVLHEDSRSLLLSKSKNVGMYKDQSHGKNRFERKRLSQIANAVKQYNQIDMNKLFKEDTLIVNIPVIGETDQYTVTIKMEGIIKEIAKNIKNNNNKLEYKTIVQALTKVFNTANIYVKCTCQDYKYRFAHWNIINNVSVDDTAQDPGPGKGIRNPKDEDGRGCKHILLVLANGSWIMKVTSVINNYIHYAEEYLQKPFLKVIFPKLYGMPAEEMVEQDLVDDDKFLDSSKGLIDAINEYGKTRGRYKAGTNKNPVTGTGGRTKKEPSKTEPDEESAEEEK